MKLVGLLAILPIILVLSCGSEPKKADPAPVETAPPAAVVQPVVETAPPAAVTQPVTPVIPPQPVEITPPEPSIPPPEPPVQTVQSAPPPPVEKAFDPLSITEEKFTTTKADVKVLIDDLNKIIRAKNYNAWVGYLSASYFKEISSPAFLEEMTEELYRRDQTVASNLGRDPRRVSKKILRTPKDYFDNVVVPSRSNDRMDDIDFVSENRVKAYTVDIRSQHRLVLYDLEMIDNKWKIIN